jgi:hypothetical protein
VHDVGDRGRAALQPSARVSEGKRKVTRVRLNGCSGCEI